MVTTKIAILTFRIVLGLKKVLRTATHQQHYLYYD
jgi:hypothetical protein